MFIKMNFDKRGYGKSYTRYKVDDNSAKKYYEENKYTFVENNPQFHAQHVLVEKEEDAKKVKERLDKGEDIKKIAKENFYRS